MSTQEASIAPEQRIDLGTFYHQFICPGRGIAMATATVQDAAAEQHLRRRLDQILVDRHSGTAAAGQTS